jgi:pyruvate,orthophosphate dikinase
MEEGLEIKSKALEVNLASYHVDVPIDQKYAALQNIMSKYYGLMDKFNTFLKELSHPYKNWEFIIKEARTYSLNYFHLIKHHSNGPNAAKLYLDIFADCIDSECNEHAKAEAADNLLLLLIKIIKDADECIAIFCPVLNDTFERIKGYDNEIFFLFVKSFYQIKRLAITLMRYGSEHDLTLTPIICLLEKYLTHTYSYWLNEEDPLLWFGKGQDTTLQQIKLKDVFNVISHDRMRKLKAALKKITSNPDNDLDRLTKLVKLPGYYDIVENYRSLPKSILEVKDVQKKTGNEWKIILLFRIMSISGLSMIHEDALRDINRTLNWLIANEPYKYNVKLIQKTFLILKEHMNDFPVSVLNCVLNMGKGISKTDDRNLVNFFIDSVIDLGFQMPMIAGVDDNWQIKANQAHVHNIRTWLTIIALYPKWTGRLLSGLIIHLSLYGVFIRDNDLFPRDVTRFLNCGIEPVYNLAKHFARLLPVYFNDIGAEGTLRDISTRMDEMTRREDILIHYLRKQSHVESSNRILSFMHATLSFWLNKDKKQIEPFLPPDILNRIHTQGQYIDGVNTIMTHLQQQGIVIPDGLLKISQDRLKTILRTISDVSDADKTRVGLITSFYKLLNQKYNHVFGMHEGDEFYNYIHQLESRSFPDIKKLKDAFTEPDIKRKSSLLIEYLGVLKNIILSDRSYEAIEDIYHKRHIAADIPSMYGSYREMKFDAMGLTFRIEAYVNVLFEQLVEDIDLSLITKATFYQIHTLLLLFNRALKIDGITSAEIELQLDFLKQSLEARGITFTQYLDIFKGFANAVKNIISKYYNHVYEQNLSKILIQVPVDRLIAKYLHQTCTGSDDNIRHVVSEVFFRDKIALSLGLQQLDVLLSKILNTLFFQADKLEEQSLHLLLNYDPKLAITSMEKKNPRVSGIIYQGSKGMNLIALHHLGLPVPPGFIITTEVFKCKKIFTDYPPAEENIKKQILYHIGLIEQKTGQFFGNPENPLLFSIRSGAAISQPGMMDTFLNVGINKKIVQGLAKKTGNVWFAWDNYRRFLQCYGMAFGLDRDDFDAIINEYKQRFSISYKRGFSGDQMKNVALTYRDFLEGAGVHFQDDPIVQLHVSIKKVFDSWYSDRAKTYRRIMGISDDWGTAVCVQKMVFGNMSKQSGSGVFFTHNPRVSSDTLMLCGDFSLENQGEDVVAGLVKTLPISRAQMDMETRDTKITLETHYPEIYMAMWQWANELIYKKGWSPQEIEFTFESPLAKDLYILQTRDMSVKARKRMPIFEQTKIKGRKPLSHGIGVSGGAMSGRIVFTNEEINQWRDLEPETSLILVRGDTVPDDIIEINSSDGLLTARGGATSHAAVVAYRLGKTCVVGCGQLICNEKEKTCTFGDIVFKSGDPISIHGFKGSVYQGLINIIEE